MSQKKGSKAGTVPHIEESAFVEDAEGYTLRDGRQAGNEDADKNKVMKLDTGMPGSKVLHENNNCWK